MAKKSKKTKSAKTSPSKTPAKKSKPQQTHDDQTQNLIDLINKPEDLLPELKRYRINRGARKGQISHPLIECSTYREGHFAYVNYVYRETVKLLEKSRKKKDFYLSVFCYSTPYLLHGFFEEICGADDKTYWTVLGSVWVESESPWKNRKIFLELFSGSRPHRDHMMDANERKAFKKLPDTLTIYRGFVGDRGKGLSWTLDRDRAVWFAQRFHVFHRKPGRLTEGICQKSDAFAYFNGREESEIVIDPNKVKQQTTITLDE